MKPEDYEDEELITVREAARILGLSSKTVANEVGGTERLARVRLGRSVRLIKSQVLEYKFKKIEEAKKLYKEIYGD